MPEYLSPGVYMEEFDSGPRPIEGVSTSTAAFLGKTERGPLNPRLVTSFPEFTRVFGGWLKDSFLAYSVDGFFKNGGKRCYVARIVSKFDREKRDKGVIIKTLDDKFIEARPIGPGKWISRLRLRVRGGSNYTDENKLFRIIVEYWDTDEGFSKKDQIDPDWVENFDDLSSDPASEYYYENKVNGFSNFINLYPIKIPGFDETKKYDDQKTLVDGWITAEYPASTVPSATKHVKTQYVRLEKDSADKKGKLSLKDGDHIVANMETQDPLDENESVWIAITDPADLSAQPKNQFDLKIVKFDNPVTDEQIAKITQPTKSYENLKTSGDGADSDHYAQKVTFTDNRSPIVKMTRIAAGRPKNTQHTLNVRDEIMDEDGFEINFSQTPQPTPVEEKDDKIELGDYIGKEENLVDNNDQIIKTIYTGLQGLERIEDISIVCAPDGNRKISKLIIEEHCEKLRDRFAIYQPDVNDSLPGAIEYLSPFGDYKYAALYTPWITVLDPLTDNPKHVPPSGFVAGIYARSDIDRGVHKAPANEVIRGIIGTPTPIDVRTQDILNPKGVNCIRTFPGRGTMVWGARTNSANPNWRYINVRRLFIFISKSIERATQWVVFEPNNEKLWSDVKATISQFLTGVWRTGALMGVTPEEAFFVRCDRSTMTEDDIQNGRLVCVIGLATTKPAEFVIFRLTQTKAGSTFEEL